METVSENEKTKTKSTVTTHYAGRGELSWTSEGSEKWTRNIPGIEGGLAAIQEASKSPVLQLHDLKGNIVGTAEDSETSTKLISTYNSTEFGVPTTSRPTQVLLARRRWSRQRTDRPLASAPRAAPPTYPRSAGLCRPDP